MRSEKSETASADARLRSLLTRWEELRQQGQSVAVEELCHDCPELVDSLRQQIAALRDLDAVLAVTANQPTQTFAPPPDPIHSQATVLTDPQAQPAAPAFASGNKPMIAGYEILGELGRGGMGVVYKARQVALKRIVAVKMILAGSHAGARQVARFKTEAEAVACLQHPNIVQIYEIGEADEHPFFALEFVEGGSLEDQLAGKPQAAVPSAQVVETLARAMHYAHQRGIVHRDLKPGNILLQKAEIGMRNEGGKSGRASDVSAFGMLPSDFGTPKITDFGLAKQLDSAEKQTQSGTILGTPSYMAPEQASGKTRSIGPATDVYALGAILYEMLTGHPPFQAESAWDTILQVTSVEPIAPHRFQPRMPRDLETICLKCLQKEPAKRYASAEALADDLHRFLAGEPILARPVGFWGRAVKWARRRPAVAALLGVVFLAAVVLLVGGVIYHLRLEKALQQTQAYAEQGRQRLVRLQVAQGVRCLDEGDALGSLVWFAEALRQDRGHPESEHVHRLRIAAVLRQCPRLAQLWFHDGPVRHAAFSSDGRLAITASEDHTARIWNVRTGEPVGPPLRHPEAVLDAAFSPDSRFTITAGHDGTARIWEVGTGRPVAAPLKHGGPVRCASFSSDGRKVVTASKDGTARVWEAATGKPVTDLLRHDGPLRHAAFSVDGKKVVTAGDDKKAQLWDAATGEAMAPSLKHDGPVYYAAFAPDGRQLVTASADGTARIWDGTTGKPLTASLKHRGPVFQATFSSGGRRVVTASHDHTARVWDAATGKALAPDMVHGSVVNTARFSSDGRRVVTASDDNTARVWDAATGEPVTPTLKHGGTLLEAAFSPTGCEVITASNDNTARVWEITPKPWARHSRVEPEPAEPSRPSKWASHDGKFLATREAGHSIQVREAATAAPVGLPCKHVGPILHAAFSPDDRRLLTASDDNTARIWDVATGELLTQPLRHNGTVRYAAFSPDGRLVVTASDDKTARVWDAATGEPITPPLPFPSTVRGASFSANGSQVSVIGKDGTITTWELLPDGRLEAELVDQAQVLAGSQVDPNRGLLPLDPEDLSKRWRRASTK